MHFRTRPEGPLCLSPGARRRQFRIFLNNLLRHLRVQNAKWPFSLHFVKGPHLCDSKQNSKNMRIWEYVRLVQ